MSVRWNVVTRPSEGCVHGCKNPFGPPRSPLPTVSLKLVSQRLTVKEVIANAVQEQVEALLREHASDFEQVRRQLDQQYLEQADIDKPVRDGKVALPGGGREEFQVNKIATFLAGVHCERHPSAASAQDQIRAQASRFRQTLEDMMCHSESFSPDELATLTRLPVVSAILSQLIMRTADGRFGLFDGLFNGGQAGAENALIDAQGKSLPINGDVSIAHVWHLFDACVLADWQQTVVSQRLVQAFKQAFRERYVLAPAEQQAGMHSQRFIGHVVDAAVISRLLLSRGWGQSGAMKYKCTSAFPRRDCSPRSVSPTPATTWLARKP